jgi:hypothetical protein
VFDLLPEEDEDVLPFRVLEEESSPGAEGSAERAEKEKVSV